MAPTGASEKLCSFLLYFTFSLALTRLFDAYKRFALQNVMMLQRYKLHSTLCRMSTPQPKFLCFYDTEKEILPCKIRAAGENLVV